ncbi:hypothetical protein ACLOJK_037855 [Asimina triloba]
MGTASVIVYTSIAVFLLFVISFSPKHPHRPHRHLKLRSSFSPDDPRQRLRAHPPIPFDPIIADIERRREDKEWERQYFQDHHKEFASASDGSAPGHESQPEWEDFMNAEDYLNDEDRFNITNRIAVLFPSLDVNPADGFVTLDELLHWNLKMARKDVLHRTQRDMEVHDKNHDGFVSFQEYEPPGWAKLSSPSVSSFLGFGLWWNIARSIYKIERQFGKYEKNAVVYSDNEKDDVGWWKEDHFNASDDNGDGLLNLTEFNE